MLLRVDGFHYFLAAELGLAELTGSLKNPVRLHSVLYDGLYVVHLGIMTVFPARLHLEAERVLLLLHHDVDIGSYRLHVLLNLDFFARLCILGHLFLLLFDDVSDANVVREHLGVSLPLALRVYLYQLLDALFLFMDRLYVEFGKVLAYLLARLNLLMSSQDSVEIFQCDLKLGYARIDRKGRSSSPAVQSANIVLLELEHFIASVHCSAERLRLYVASCDVQESVDLDLLYLLLLLRRTALHVNLTQMVVVNALRLPLWVRRFEVAELAESLFVSSARPVILTH